MPGLLVLGGPLERGAVVSLSRTCQPVEQLLRDLLDLLVLLRLGHQLVVFLGEQRSLPLDDLPDLLLLFSAEIHLTLIQQRAEELAALDLLLQLALADVE